MYRRFVINIKNNELFSLELIQDYSDYRYFDEEIRNKEGKHLITEQLKKTRTIDVTKLQNECYPVSEYDIFISHSGKDKYLAIGLASWLERTFGLKVFIDANVWTSLEEVKCKLKELSNGNISPERIEQNSFIMLVNAISDVMNKSECIFFLNTDNFSIDSRLERTTSPWLSYEMQQSTLIKTQVPYYMESRIRDNGIAERRLEYYMTCEITIQNEFRASDKLTSKELQEWEARYLSRRIKHPLQYLYYGKAHSRF